MPNDQVLLYLRENKEKFSKEALVEQLGVSGYPEADIAESISIVYGGISSEEISRWNFWDFKTVHAYRSFSEKTWDALFGFFTPFLFFFIFPLGFLLDIFFLIYFWGRRRFIAYGVLDRWLVFFCFFLFFVFLWSFPGRF